jgi:hypothetical protein
VILYRQLKKANTTQEGKKMMTNEMIKKLEDRGFKRWTKGNYDRLYINADTLGLELGFYNTGNISSARFQGNSISHAEGGRLRYAKTYIDVKTGKVYSQHDWLQEAAEAILSEVENEEAQAQAETQAQETETNEQEEHEMKSRNEWINEAQMEIEGLKAAGEEVTREAIREELEQNALDPEIKAVIDAEGGIEEYLESLWSYIEDELKRTTVYRVIITEDRPGGMYDQWIEYETNDRDDAITKAKEIRNDLQYIPEGKYRAVEIGIFPADRDIDDGFGDYNIVEF